MRVICTPWRIIGRSSKARRNVSEGQDVVQDSPKDLFEKALSAFLKEERANILSGTAERNLAARLGFKLERYKEEFGLGRYYVDPEYNRMQKGRVKLMLDEDMVEVVIQCDLLVHGRGELGARENIIAIEMKKSGRPHAETLNDQRRLRALTMPPGRDMWSADGKTFPKYVCGYELGIFIELDIANTSYYLEEYRAGKMVGQRNGEF